MANRALEILQAQLVEQEQTAVGDFTQAMSQLRSFEHQLRQLEAYRRSYMEQALERGGDGMLASGFHQYQAFIQTIEKAETDQQQSVTRLTHNVEQKRQTWLQVQSRRKAIEQLIIRQRERQERVEARQEQKLLDEYATLYSVKNTTPLI